MAVSGFVSGAASWPVSWAASWAASSCFLAQSKHWAAQRARLSGSGTGPVSVTEARVLAARELFFRGAEVNFSPGPPPGPQGAARQPHGLAKQPPPGSKEPGSCQELTDSRQMLAGLARGREDPPGSQKLVRKWGRRAQNLTVGIRMAAPTLAPHSGTWLPRTCWPLVWGRPRA